MRSLAENQDVAGLHKMPTSVEGFDAITGGGLPRNRTSLILGGPGSGKTVFALQTLVNGARQFGEPGIFVAFEENSRHILANAASFGWNLPKLGDREKPGATPPSHRMFPALLDTKAIASSASPHSKRGSALAVKDGHRGRSTASAVS